MKKNIKKNTLTAVTGATVIGVAAAALVNGSKLEAVFNPGKFEKIQNNYKSEEYDYIAGDGEETDIAGENRNNNEKDSGNDLQVLQLKKQESGNVKDNESFGIADNGDTVENTDSPETSDTGNNSVELSENQNSGNADTTPVRNWNNSSGTGNTRKTVPSPSFREISGRPQ